MSKLKEKPTALKGEHLAFKKLRFINYVRGPWVILPLLDPDPDCEFGSGYGSRDPIESGSGSTALVERYGTQSILLIS